MVAVAGETRVSHDGLWTRRGRSSIGEYDGFIYGVTQPTEANTYFWYGETPTLTPVHGDGDAITITTPGIYEDNDYDCYITVNAAAATTANPIILRHNLCHGGTTTDSEKYLIRVQNSPQPGAVIVEGNKIDARTIFDRTTGVRAEGNCIVRRNDISNTVDYCMGIHDNNQFISNYGRLASYMASTVHSDGHTHNDAIQISGGAHCLIWGNDFAETPTAVFMIKAENPALYGAITDCVIKQNWMNSLCGASINVYRKTTDADISMTITDNILGPLSYTSGHYQILIATGTTLTISGNVKDIGGAATISYLTYT